MQKEKVNNNNNENNNNENEEDNNDDKDDKTKPFRYLKIIIFLLLANLYFLFIY